MYLITSDSFNWSITDKWCRRNVGTPCYLKSGSHNCVFLVTASKEGNPWFPSKYKSLWGMKFIIQNNSEYNVMGNRWLGVRCRAEGRGGVSGWGHWAYPQHSTYPAKQHPGWEKIKLSTRLPHKVYLYVHEKTQIYQNSQAFMLLASCALAQLVCYFTV